MSDLITRLSKLDAPDREFERDQYRKEYREAFRNCWKDDAAILRAKEASHSE